MPVDAGPKNDAAMPKIVAETARCQTSTTSVKNTSATTICAAARTASDAIMIRRRGRRSAQTPPTRVKTRRPPIVRAEDDAEVARVADREHGERRRHRHDRVADRRE